MAQGCRLSRTPIFSKKCNEYVSRTTLLVSNKYLVDSIDKNFYFLFEEINYFLIISQSYSTVIWNLSS